MPARIFLVDDHDIVRQGVSILLESRPDWEICGEAKSGEAAIAGVSRHRPDIVILDISMPGLDGLQAAQEITKLGLKTRILIFTMHDSPTLVKAAIDAGAHGMVLKSSATRDLIAAVQTILGGGTFFLSGDTPRSNPGSDFGGNMLLRTRLSVGFAPA